MVLLQLILLVIAGFFCTYFPGFGKVLGYELYFIIFFGWLISIWLTHKHKLKYYQRKVKYILAPLPKAFVIHLVVILISAMLIGSVNDNLGIMMSVVTIYAFIEYVFMIVWARFKVKGTGNNVVQPDIAKYNQDDLDLTKGIQPRRIPAELLQKVAPDELGIIFPELDRKWESSNSETGGPNDFFYGGIQEFINTGETDLSLIILNTRVNDIGEINAVFKKVYNSLNSGGYFVACYNNISDTDNLLRNKFPSILYYLAYPIHWLFYRVLSKMSTTAGLQEWLSRGKNKVISWAEVYGRLAYCGFDVEFDERYHGMQYVIAHKTKTISNNPSPSFYVFIKLNRVSLYGNIIKINKVRSMYPYSEFLQKRIFEQNSLGNGGKFNVDPRITPQGKIFRKYWIDELPQLLDWLRGEIKLVGIRAMSQHFFSLYSQGYKDLYLKVKPGIISPIFDENSDTFQDIERIEYEYLENYMKHPLKTDWKYFWITAQSILKGVRSK